MPQFILNLVLLIAISLPTAYAGTKFDSGVRTSVSRFGNMVVEVHESEHFNTLWYKVGQISNQQIRWGKSINYDRGIRPSVAILGDTVVEVHQSYAKTHYRENYPTLQYRVGKLDPASMQIAWGKSIVYLYDGVSPKIAVTNNKLIAQSMVPHLYHVEETTDENGGKHYYYHYYYTLQYLIGSLSSESRTISWIDAGQTTVPVASAALASDGNTVVEVSEHEHEQNNYLWYSVGKIYGNAMLWGTLQNYDKGSSPAISMSNGNIIETHRCGNSMRKLCYATGGLDPYSPTINWSEYEQYYDTGIRPTLAIDGNDIIETHESEFFSSIYFNLGKFDIKTRAIDWY